MEYKFKVAEEAFWVGLTAAVLFGLQVAAEFDASMVTDWKTWAISLGGGAVRAAAGAVIAWRAAR